MNLKLLDYILAIISGGVFLGGLYFMWRFLPGLDRGKVWYVNDNQLHLYKTVWELYHEGNPKAAKATCDLLTADPELHPLLSVRVSHLLALIATDESDYQQARKLLLGALTLAENHAGPIDQLILSSTLATVYFLAGSKELAYKHLTQAEGLIYEEGVPVDDPDFRIGVMAPIYRNLASLLEEAGELQLSIQHLEKAKELWADGENTELNALIAEQDLLEMQRKLVQKLYFKNDE